MARLQLGQDGSFVIHSFRHSRWNLCRQFVLQFVFSIRQIEQVMSFDIAAFTLSSTATEEWGPA
jgi:hypothetical protein